MHIQVEETRPSSSTAVPVSAPRTMLNELSYQDIARQLIQAGLRISLIQAMTKISIRTLRRLWKEIHGTSPVTGKLPETVLAYISTVIEAQILSAFVAAYRSRYGLDLTPGNLLAGWRSFNRQICVAPRKELNINAAYYAVRDVRAGIVVLAQCGNCKRNFIYDRGSTKTEKCPFCKEKIH